MTNWKVTKKGYIQFEELKAGKGAHTRIHTIPLRNFSMLIVIDDKTVDEPEENTYRHYFYDGDKEIEVDGVTYSEAEEWLMEGTD